MSRYCGNGDTCPTCGITYGAFRCVIITTYREAFECLMDCSDDPADWRYKRRGTILGFWHMCKSQDWEQHKRDCAEAAAYEARMEEEERGDAWEPPEASLVLEHWPDDQDIPF